ncbi:MAG: hypothetical protein JXJ19_00755 [Elusimicrobia bacterium]|nr:hypothetical protein [Elusimicrobiota bacterium]
MNPEDRTIDILLKIAERYGLNRLKEVLGNSSSGFRQKDIFICLKNIVGAAETEGDTLELLKSAKNIYGAPIFAVNPGKGEYLIKKEPDFDRAVESMAKYSFCFKLSPYHAINTYLVVLEAQIAGLDLDELCRKGEEHIEASIKDSLENNPNWDENTLLKENPVLIMPVGAAGCGKSTFYRELSDVVNISCDNIRYMLFMEYGPCFSSWESAVAWWIVNYLTDMYLGKGYSVFYNGVNTDLEYRSPITMENPDPLFKGVPYDIKIAYFEPPVKLSSSELKELKDINLWKTRLEDLDRSSFSPGVERILLMIERNYKRTLDRTSQISEGKSIQDPFDVLYAVPVPVVKLFVEQSFDKPEGDNVIVIERRIIEDPQERSLFYKRYAEQMSS